MQPFLAKGTDQKFNHQNTLIVLQIVLVNFQMKDTSFVLWGTIVK